MAISIQTEGEEPILNWQTALSQPSIQQPQPYLTPTLRAITGVHVLDSHQHVNQSTLQVDSFVSSIRLDNPNLPFLFAHLPQAVCHKDQRCKLQTTIRSPSRTNSRSRVMNTSTSPSESRYGNAMATSSRFRARARSGLDQPERLLVSVGTESACTGC